MKKFIPLLVIPFLVSSCVILAPIINTFKETGAMQADREMLLHKAVKKFHQLQATRTPEQSATFAKDEIKAEMANQLRAQGKRERIIESMISTLEFQEESHKATLVMNVKYYRVMQSVVKERLVEEKWEFVSTAQGWKVASITPLDK